MLLLRGATCDHCGERLKQEAVSIHAPLARSNARACGEFGTFPVSIHAPLARSNLRLGNARTKTGSFNTCSSCEEQHTSDFRSEDQSSFQYMLLLRGATSSVRRYVKERMFQYMLLLRGATQHTAVHPEPELFQYMLLLRGATSISVPASGYFLRFNTCSSCEEQPLRQLCECVDGCFNTCSSCEEQQKHTKKTR